MKINQRTITISFILILNISSVIVLAGPGLMFAGSYSPPIETQWDTFERHYSITNFVFNTSMYSGYDSFFVSFHVLKNELPLILDVKNGTSHARPNITNDFSMTLQKMSYFYISADFLESKISELELTIEGINSGRDILINSNFLRFSFLNDFKQKIQYPDSNNESDNSLYIDFYLNIKEMNGTGNIYIGQGNELGDYFIRPKMTISAPGNYSAPLKIQYFNVPISNTKDFILYQSLNLEDYSSMVWDVQGQFKAIIYSYETNYYSLTMIIAYFYLFSIIILDTVFISYFLIKFFVRKISIRS